MPRPCLGHPMPLARLSWPLALTTSHRYPWWISMNSPAIRHWMYLSPAACPAAWANPSQLGRESFALKVTFIPKRFRGPEGTVYHRRIQTRKAFVFKTRFLRAQAGFGFTVWLRMGDFELLMLPPCLQSSGITDVYTIGAWLVRS